MKIDPAWVGVLYFGISLFAVLSVQSLLKVICGLLMMSWGVVIFLVFFGSSELYGNISESSVHASAFLVLISGLVVFVVGLSLVYRRKIQGLDPDEPMRELKH